MLIYVTNLVARRIKNLGSTGECSDVQTMACINRGLLATT